MSGMWMRSSSRSADNAGFFGGRWTRTATSWISWSRAAGARELPSAFSASSRRGKRDRQGSGSPTRREAMRPPVGNSACRLLIEPGNTRTTGLRCPISTPRSENAECVISSQQRRSSVFARSMRPPTIHSGSHAIVSSRSIIDSFGSGPSPLGKPRRLFAERRITHRCADRTASAKIT